MNKAILHAVAATAATLAITVFWSATVVSELFLDHAAIAAVKHAIAYAGVPVLAAAMALTGASGAMLAKGRGLMLLALDEGARMTAVGLVAGDKALLSTTSVRGKVADEKIALEEFLAKRAKKGKLMPKKWLVGAIRELPM
ncbi:hypothetical protein [Chromobacterium phragmitis]|uniref:Uncharacterized protein n=1 Tax=Chromobacterium phragmitis TaxID=2202141 RepID=A0ABV0IV74_9NEIS